MTDAFNFENLKLPTGFGGLVTVKKQLLGVSVRKPNAQEFVRTNSDPQYRRDVALIQVKDDNSFYAVAPPLVEELSDLCEPYTVVLAVTRSMSPILWPIRLPDAEGKSHGSALSQREAAVLAQEQWVRIKWNRSESTYDVFTGDGIKVEPEFPDKTFSELLGVAFKGQLIDSPDHIVVRQLRGQA